MSILRFIATNERTRTSGSEASSSRVSKGTVLFWATQNRMSGCYR